MRQSIVYVVCIFAIVCGIQSNVMKTFGCWTFKINIIDSRLYHLAVDENGYTIWLINFDKSRIKLTNTSVYYLPSYFNYLSFNIFYA